MNKKQLKRKQKFEKFMDILSTNALKQQSKIEHLEFTNNNYSKVIHNTTKDFLLSSEWQNLRLKVIEKYGNKCLCCGCISTPENPLNIDHIKPRKLYPELALDFDNLQPLCSKCNKKKANINANDYRKN